MEDLDDHMLAQILIRLPYCVTVIACSPVSKRWYSIISEPSFHSMFAYHHKKKTTNLLMGSSSGSDIDESPWTISKITGTKWIPNGYKVNNTIRFIRESIFGSPKLSLKFLPCNTISVEATFKDLVLCYSYLPYQGSDRLVYYITNPLTKQWVALPPCPLDEHKWITSTALICQPPYNHTQDYKYRVVAVRRSLMDYSLESLDLVVYCSEIGEWKEIKLSLPKVCTPEPDTVVCNGIVYFKSGLCLVGLDPFDVNDTCEMTLEAIVMPPLPDFGYLLESSGQLLLVHTPGRRGVSCLWYKKDGTDIELKMVVWKLDPNQAPLAWETTFNGLCKGTGKKTKSCNSGLGLCIYATDVAVHPYNDKLIYMYFSSEQGFVLCNTRTGCIELLKSSSSYNVPSCESLFRLELQWWPTLVPALQ
ncbi:uncharacterized protein LOC141627772 [Silene latifolia]|uniref:uncharacterized protein LOC141627772 n=1 Tax=Silene latifolia TaxID=37657 RepID=UPI003D76D94D